MISQQEYQARRTRLAKALAPNSLAIIPAAKELIRNGDAHYPFRQSSNFYYLTGFEEPDALLVIIAGQESQSILFNRERNLAEEQWTGKRLGQEGALEFLGMQGAYPIGSLMKELPNFLAGKTALYYPLGQDIELDKSLLQALNLLKKQSRKGLKAPEAFCDLEPILNEMRLFKSPAEIEGMRRAARISVQAHQRAMRQCKHVQFEYQVEAELVYELKRLGCQNLAYAPIVAGGENACILHYTENNQALRPGDLLLIDAGGEYQGYAADITRTFPINGRFSPEQKSIYNLVKKAQQAAIAAIKPGLAWNSLQQVIVKILTEGLADLGILQGSLDELIEKEAYRPFYMHNSGHWLGLDVHDVGSYKINSQWRPLEAGMVLTVEPGIYISEAMTMVDARWRGIGVRIEDDVLVTQTTYEILSAGLEVETDEIEALMRG